TATDVYGLGAVLYALLTGRPPFQAETVLDTLTRLREQEPESPRRRNPAVDRDLDAICLKCLEKEPARRYESAEALALDLERWLAGEPIVARRPTLLQRLGSWFRRHPSVVVSAVLLLVLTALGFALSTFLLWQEKEQTNAALREKETALDAKESA